jgi:hypothetical protein
VRLLTFYLLLISWNLTAQSDTLEAPADTLTYYGEIDKEEADVLLPSPYHPPSLPTVERRPIEAKQWEDASGALDYSNDVPKPPKERRQRPPGANANPVDWTSATQWLGSFFQVLAVILAVAAIAFGIWRMLQAPTNRPIARDGVEITLENLEQYLQETDLDRFLREALTQGNYSLAIRIYYLQIIKNLSTKQAIRWAREKTNRDYQREMSGHVLAEPFKWATHTYERVWYGDTAPDAALFARLEPQFKQLLAEIDSRLK